MITKSIADESAQTIVQPSLTASQKQRVAMLTSVYSEDVATQLVKLIDARGENSWKKVNEKIDFLQRADYKQKMYDDTLYDNFALDEVYSSDDVIKTVGMVRREMGLPIYLSSLKRNCENDFFKLFIVKDVYEEELVDTDDGFKTKKKLIGHKPVFSLRQEE